MEKKLKNKIDIRKAKGITLVALVITIVIMLILAGVVIKGITGDNGIIENTKKAKEQTEIEAEKEIIEQAAVVAMGKNKQGDITEEDLKANLSNELGEVKIYDDDEVFILEIIDSQRYYTLSKEGEIGETDKTAIIIDETPGELEGKGTQTEPYKIMSIEDLVYLSKSVSEGTTYYQKYIELGRNLNFNAKMSYGDYNTKEYNEYLGITEDVGLKEALTNRKYKGFIPIGNGTNKFMGNFDGKNYSIKNIYENVNGYGGIFGEINFGSVSNLTVKGEFISSSNYVGGISGISGKSSGNIKECINYGNIYGTGDWIGGISGRYGALNGCKNYGEIRGNNYVGGIIGQMNTTINKVNNHGKVIGNANVGGIAGNSSGIRNSYNEGEITGNTAVGGIIGYGSSIAPIINCYNIGKIIGTTRVGGIAGYCQYTQNNQSKIINTYNKGEIIGTNKVGAILGEKTGYGIHYIENCYLVEKEGLVGYNLSKAVNGDLVVTDSTGYSKEYIEGKETAEKSFIEVLNEKEDIRY